jgi:hypothetical protein
MLPQRQGGQLQAHYPSLRASVQDGHGLRREIQAPHLAQESRRFIGRETEIGGAQLGEPVPGSQTREW